MRTSFLPRAVTAICFAVGLASGAAARADDSTPQNELAKLRGEWRSSTVAYDGGFGATIVSVRRP